MSAGIALFHGSNIVLEHPTPDGGHIHNDYGQGLYCTESLELAREWACSELPSAFVNHYSLNPDIPLKECNLLSDEYHVLNWLAILLKNRRFDISYDMPATIREYILQEFLPDLKDFDIIRGYRADDSYFGIAKAFLMGSLPLEELGNALRLGKLGVQVFIKSEKAFDSLCYLTAEAVDRDIYLARRAQRDQAARQAFRQISSQNPALTGTFAIDIVRNKWRNNDARLF